MLNGWKTYIGIAGVALVQIIDATGASLWADALGLTDQWRAALEVFFVTLTIIGAMHKDAKIKAAVDEVETLKEQVIAS